MTISQCLHKKGWNVACVTLGARYMIVHISFVNNEGVDDEVSFDIPAWSSKNLNECFTNFCKENKFPRNTVGCISIVAAAETLEKLQEIDM